MRSRERAAAALTLAAGCADNMVNGLPQCGNPLLDVKLLRGAWNWTGVMISDGGAVGDPGFHTWAVNQGIPADKANAAIDDDRIEVPKSVVDKWAAALRAEHGETCVFKKRTRSTSGGGWAIKGQHLYQFLLVAGAQLRLIREVHTPGCAPHVAEAAAGQRPVQPL